MVKASSPALSSSDRLGETPTSAATRAWERAWHTARRMVPGLDREGGQACVKFIILGRSRTGSNLLRGLLNSQRGVLVLGEIFKNPQGIEWGMEGIAEPPGALALYRADPVRFLDSCVFDGLGRRSRAVGFKLFYYHAQEESRRAVWEHLRRQPDLHVIHIQRANILRTHLSRARAERDNRWVNLTGERETRAPIELRYEDCLQDFMQTRTWEEEFDRFFQAQPKRRVLYESLAADLARELRRIQEFLGLPLETPRPQTHRQAQEPLDQAISNYAELKRRFQGSPWAAFFED
ncbi:MAG TPA: sulfotransferase [Anaerolineales bacterium]|nr:sulfotransferase [Anaerolineales bacterium]